MTYQSCCGDALSMYTVIETFPIFPSKSLCTQDWDCLWQANLDHLPGCLLLTLLYWASYHHFKSFFMFLAIILMCMWFTPSCLLGHKFLLCRNILMCHSLCIPYQEYYYYSWFSPLYVICFLQFYIPKAPISISILQLSRNSIKVLGKEMTRNDHPIKPWSYKTT